MRASAWSILLLSRGISLFGFAEIRLEYGLLFHDKSDRVIDLHIPLPRFFLKGGLAFHH
jgi:hypothetical protein